MQCSATPHQIVQAATHDSARVARDSMPNSARVAGKCSLKFSPRSGRLPIARRFSAGY